MFFRRLMRADSSLRNDGPPSGMQSMDITLQNRFSKGVNYNMKIIIKGDRNVGKTCLLARLQGQKFKDEYIPTDEIQVASINWNYKTSDDVIKVEIWDVVDKGRKKRKIDGLKLDTNQGCEDMCLDGDLINVYKGAHCVIIVFDITKQWTFDYVEKEVEKIPPGLPLLLLGNHRDMGHHRTVTDLQAKSLVEQIQITRETPVRYTACSMRNGFGLKFIHKFFNIPFLHLQKSCLVRQLETNGEETLTTLDELDMLQESKDLSYESFIDGLTNKRHVEANLLSPSDKKIINDKEKSLNGKDAERLDTKNNLPNHLMSEQIINKNNITRHQTDVQGNIKKNVVVDEGEGDHRLTSIEKVHKDISTSKSMPANLNTTNNSNAFRSTNKPSTLINKLPNSKDEGKYEQSSQSTVSPSNYIKNIPVASGTSFVSTLTSVDDFQPEDEILDINFLEIDSKTTNNAITHNAFNSDSSDDEKLNPLVQRVDAEYDEDEDINDEGPLQANIHFQDTALFENNIQSNVHLKKRDLTIETNNYDLNSSTSQNKSNISNDKDFIVNTSSINTLNIGDSNKSNNEYLNVLENEQTDMLAKDFDSNFYLSGSEVTTSDSMIFSSNDLDHFESLNYKPNQNQHSVPSLTHKQKRQKKEKDEKSKKKHKEKKSEKSSKQYEAL